MKKDTAYYTLSPEEVESHLKTSSENGLSEQEAQQRLQVYGRNILELKRKRSILKLLLEQFVNPIVWVLIVAAVLAFIFGEIVEGIAVVIVIVINAVIGFTMELQAIRSMEKLQSMARVKAKVYRGGKRKEIDSAQIVPGDLLFVEAGDVVTADARVIAQNNLAVKESALTGESAQIEKDTEPLPEDTVIADQKNSVFKGTVVTRGNGKAIVVATGIQTELGNISELVHEAEKEATPLSKKLTHLSKRLIVFTLAITLLIFITGMLRGMDWLLMIETAVALAVAAIPEGLPVIATIALARGMLKLARKSVLVKTLQAVQSLGETNVIFTDKTGTLTENEMYADSFVFDDSIQTISDKSALKSNPAFKRYLEIGILCNESSLSINKKGEEKSSGDPIEVALFRLAYQLSEDPETIRKEHPRVAEVPFDASIKMMGTVNKMEKGYLVCVKGAAEAVIEKSTHVLEGDNILELTPERKKKWIKEADEIAAKGLRVLAFAFREIAEKPTDDQFIHDLVFTNITGFIDPARADVKDAIAECKHAGIKVVMVTGDHPETARTIAGEVGITDAQNNRVTHGRQLNAKDLSDDEKRQVLNTLVFARVNPEQKLDLVTIFQKNNYILGMTGDGVNDAPALKKADIGIAMGIRGTEAAKEAADLILKDDAFSSIVLAVKQGRIIFENIRKFVVYLLSCNLSEILVVATASFLNMPLPLLPLQILFLNMVTDVFPALALGMNKGEENIMQQPPRNPSEPILTKKLWSSIILYGLFLTVAVIGAEFYADRILRTNADVTNNITFYTLVLAQLWNVVNLPDHHVSFFKNEVTKNKYVWYALVLCILIVGVAYLIEPVRVALSLVPVQPNMMLVVLGFSLLPIILIQFFKRVVKVIK